MASSSAWIPVQVVTGDVRVNGAVTSVSDEANHVEVVPKSRDRTDVFYQI